MKVPAIRPTREGIALCGLTLAISAVAVASGNNLLYMIVAVLWSLGGLSVAAGQWNLRGLSAVRLLPAELFAGIEANGRIQIRNRRRWMPSMDLEVRDLDTTAHGRCGIVEPGCLVALRVGWRFDRRGQVILRGLRVESTFPFGLTKHQVELPVRADLLVFARPGPASVRQHPGEREGGVEATQGRGISGDFLGLRPYRPGDRPGSIHWRTTARVGEVVVVERAGDVETYVEVVVDQRRGLAWERELSRATGEVIRAFGKGCRVGMLLRGVEGGDERLRPNTGGVWRRELLEILARQPELPA